MDQEVVRLQRFVRAIDAGAGRSHASTDTPSTRTVNAAATVSNGAELSVIARPPAYGYAAIIAGFIGGVADAG